MRIHGIPRLVLLALPLVLVMGFRGKELGQPCDGIPEAEHALGSHFLGSIPHDGGSMLLTFRGTFEGREASIAYGCRGDRLYAQTITVQLATESAARRLVETLRAALSDRLGPAVAGGTRAVRSGKLPPRAEPSWSIPSVDAMTWLSADESVSLSLDRYSSREWHVSLGALWLH